LRDLAFGLKIGHKFDNWICNLGGMLFKLGPTRFGGEEEFKGFGPRYFPLSYFGLGPSSNVVLAF